jgi:hypothetical protein
VEHDLCQHRRRALVLGLHSQQPEAARLAGRDVAEREREAREREQAGRVVRRRGKHLLVRLLGLGGGGRGREAGNGVGRSGRAAGGHTTLRLSARCHQGSASSSWPPVLKQEVPRAPHLFQLPAPQVVLREPLQQRHQPLARRARWAAAAALGAAAAVAAAAPALVLALAAQPAQQQALRVNGSALVGLKLLAGAGGSCRLGE